MWSDLTVIETLHTRFVGGDKATNVVGSKSLHGINDGGILINDVVNFTVTRDLGGIGSGRYFFKRSGKGTEPNNRSSKRPRGNAGKRSTSSAEHGVVFEREREGDDV